MRQSLVRFCNILLPVLMIVGILGMTYEMIRTHRRTKKAEAALEKTKAGAKAYDDQSKAATLRARTSILASQEELNKIDMKVAHILYMIDVIQAGYDQLQQQQQPSETPSTHHSKHRGKPAATATPPPASSAP